MEHQVKAYAFIAPSLLILTVFVFIPLAGAIGISLMNIDIYMKNISFAGIANYIKMFQDERVANATFHTFYFALLEVPLQMIVALLLLMFMLRNTKLHKLLRTVFYLPYVCSMTAVSIINSRDPALLKQSTTGETTRQDWSMEDFGNEKVDFGGSGGHGTDGTGVLQGHRDL